MWLCTKLGFYSIVRKAPDEFHVRARCRDDLVNLRQAVAARIHKPAARWKLHRTEPADYRFRIVVTAVQLQGIMQVLAMELDYSNFKGVVAATEDQQEKLPIYSAFHHDLERWQNQPATSKRAKKFGALRMIDGDYDEADAAIRLRRLIPGIEHATD